MVFCVSKKKMAAKIPTYTIAGLSVEEQLFLHAISIAGAELRPGVRDAFCAGNICVYNHKGHQDACIVLCAGANQDSYNILCRTGMQRNVQAKRLALMTTKGIQEAVVEMPLVFTCLLARNLGVPSGPFETPQDAVRHELVSKSKTFNPQGGLTRHLVEAADTMLELQPHASAFPPILRSPEGVAYMKVFRRPFELDHANIWRFIETWSRKVEKKMGELDAVDNARTIATEVFRMVRHVQSLRLSLNPDEVSLCMLEEHVPRRGLLAVWRAKLQVLTYATDGFLHLAVLIDRVAKQRSWRAPHVCDFGSGNGVALSTIAAMVGNSVCWGVDLETPSYQRTAIHDLVQKHVLDLASSGFLRARKNIERMDHAGVTVTMEDLGGNASEEDGGGGSSKKTENMLNEGDMSLFLVTGIPVTLTVDNEKFKGLDGVVSGPTRKDGRVPVRVVPRGAKTPKDVAVVPGSLNVKIPWQLGTKLHSNIGEMCSGNIGHASQLRVDLAPTFAAGVQYWVDHVVGMHAPHLVTGGAFKGCLAVLQRFDAETGKWTAKITSAPLTMPPAHVMTEAVQAFRSDSDVQIKLEHLRLSSPILATTTFPDNFPQHHAPPLSGKTYLQPGHAYFATENGKRVGSEKKCFKRRPVQLIDIRGEKNMTSPMFTFADVSDSRVYQSPSEAVEFIGPIRDIPDEFYNMLSALADRLQEPSMPAREFKTRLLVTGYHAVGASFGLVRRPTGNCGPRSRVLLGKLQVDADLSFGNMCAPQMQTRTICYQFTPKELKAAVDETDEFFAGDAGDEVCSTAHIIS